ncbi:MAG: XrtA/PEP-CTERM system TPR-repeat protein PrsT [Paraglaciecola sp.]|uniref:XrtA/PEP-CTERM system TPR-repeat protein PrsT n=1 Tax=Paraglaciecola sp. TaxID=1920173 RepID=UPI00329988DB
MRALLNSICFKNVLVIACIILSIHFSSFTIANTQIHYEKALLAYKEKQFEESMIHLKSALLATPENLPSKILMAQLLAQLGHFESAELEFEDVITQGADISLFADVWGATLMQRKAYQKIIDFQQFAYFSESQRLNWLRLRASACMSAKNYDCAIQSYLDIDKLAEDGTETLNGLASVQLNLKQFEMANEYLNQAIKVDPNNPITWQLKGLVAKNNNQLELALTHLRKAFELDPDDPYILRHLADVYLATNNNKAAKDTINTILSVSPNDPFAILVNSWLQKDTALEDKAEKKFKEVTAKINNLPNEYVLQEHSLLFLRGLVNFRQQRYADSARDFIHLRKKDENDISAVVLLAKNYIALGKEKEAILLLEDTQQDLLELPDVLVMLADLYINNNKNFKALSLLQTLQIKYPENISIQLLEAKLKIARGKIQSGMEHLDFLVSKYPEDQDILLVHSVLNLQTQQFSKANTSISKLLEITPSDATKLNIKGAILIQQNQIDEAQIFIKKALDILPSLLSAKINLASTYYLQNNYLSSIHILEDILRGNPSYEPALILMAKIQYSQNKLDEAYKNYRQVLVNDRNNIEALEGVTSIYLSKNERVEALVPLNKLGKIESLNPKYMIQKAQIYLSLGDDENSQYQIESLKLIAKENAALLLALSKLQLLKGDLQEALQSLKSAQTIQPNSLKVGILLAELLLNNDLTEDAVVQMKLLSSKFKNSPDVLFLQGRLAEQQGQIDQASQLYLNTLNMNDQHEIALAKLYSLLSHGAAPEPFKNKINEIVSTHPDRYFPRNLLAQFYFYSNEYSKAAFHYEKLLNHKAIPNRPALLNRLALVFMPTDILKSSEYARKAYRLDNTNPEILTTYGWLLTQQSQPSKGLELLRKASARGQQVPEIRYYIAVSLEKLGLFSEARSELESLFEKNVDFSEQQEAKALYEKLKEM